MWVRMPNTVPGVPRGLVRRLVTLRSDRANESAMFNVKRRTDVIGIFLNEAFIVRLIGGVPHRGPVRLQ